MCKREARQISKVFIVKLIFFTSQFEENVLKTHKHKISPAIFPQWQGFLIQKHLYCSIFNINFIHLHPINI